MDIIEGLGQVTTDFERRAAGIAPDQWGLPTPCEDWAVRDLVDHIIRGNRFAVLLLAGAQPAAAFAEVSAGDFGEPLSDLRSSGAEQLAAFRRPGALDTLCHHPRGDMPGAAFARLRLGDLLIHGWDLARATGGDETLDERLVLAAYEAYAPVAQTIAKSGNFGAGPSGTLPADASPQLRLLDLTGRRP
ncbi:MAG TPA: TIGR03086 family metal-binding protein [Mycobacteriales bacterium]|nr:TIGR03086 family metal-binding protein [Mycobacteriales bacterium]